MVKLYDVIWCTSQHLPQADTYLKSIPDDFKMSRGVNGWIYFRSCPIPRPDGTYLRDAEGSCVMVNFPGITIINPRKLVPIPQTAPVQKRFQATDYLDIEEVKPGLIGGALKEGFWKREDVSKFKSEILEKEKRAKEAVEKAIKKLPKEEGSTPEDVAHAVRQYFETIAIRVNPPQATPPALLSDKALVNIALMVKLTGEIQIPELEQWVDQCVEKKAPVVDLVWRPKKDFTEFLTDAHGAMSGLVHHHRMIKDPQGRVRAA